MACHNPENQQSSDYILKIIIDLSKLTNLLQSVMYIVIYITTFIMQYSPLYLKKKKSLCLFHSSVRCVLFKFELFAPNITDSTSNPCLNFDVGNEDSCGPHNLTAAITVPVFGLCLSSIHVLSQSTFQFHGESLFSC